MRTILDTGPLVALLNKRDRHHEWAKEAFARVEPPVWTCEAVITEASHLLGKPGEILEMVAGRNLRIGLDVEEQAPAIAALVAKYGKRMDLADACIVRMSELTKRCVVMTTDREDFSFYRRNGRDVIPLIAPDED